MVCGELPDLAVQGGQLLALLGQADYDLAALHITVVKGVHRLAILQHNVVGDVHNVVDGAHTHGTQPLPHPLGGGGDLHVADHPGGIAGAQVGGRSLHIQQLNQIALSAALDLRLVEAQGDTIGSGSLTGQTNDRKAVGAVGGDLKLHHMVVQAHHRLQVVPGFTVLMKDEDTVGDAVGELRLLGVEVLQGADGVGFCVVGHQVALVEVGAHRVGAGGGAAQVQAGVEGAVRLDGGLQHLGAHHWTEHLVPGLDVCGDRGLVLVQRMVVVQQGGRGDGCIGKVPGIQAQLTEAAQHPVRLHTTELALFDLLAARQAGLVQGHRDQVAHMDVPGPGDDLDRLGLSNFDLADPHVVGVGVTFHGQDLSYHYIGDFPAQVVSQFHLRAGQGHGLGKIFIIGINGNKLAEPFAR